MTENTSTTLAQKNTLNQFRVLRMEFGILLQEQKDYELRRETTDLYFEGSTPKKRKDYLPEIKAAKLRSKKLRSLKKQLRGLKRSIKKMELAAPSLQKIRDDILVDDLA